MLDYRSVYCLPTYTFHHLDPDPDRKLEALKLVFFAKYSQSPKVYWDVHGT